MSAPPPAAADPALLDSVTAGALGWLGAHRDRFRLPADVTTDADPNLTLKPLGELAELARLIQELHPRADVREAAGELFAFAWEQFGQGALHVALMRNEPQAVYPVELYGVFARTGLRHPEADALLTTVTGLRRWRVAGGDHTRTLSVLGAERRIGLPPHADPAAVFALTGLGVRAEPWLLDLRAAYGLTHDVFHLTDWGRARHRMAAPFAAYLRLWLPCWLEGELERELWDLVGELLAVAACLPRPWYAAEAWHHLAAAQRPDGSVPERADPADVPYRDDPFLTCYHSTLVTAFAATLARAGADTAPNETSGAACTTAPGPESEAAP
ncbi:MULTISPECIES: DUF6895 family protein [Streptomyces]|uniref:DUF6895 family protein n=1 Tax=Streptomyces ramulosus TaxID=47762 RepID=A0ABW1FD54_9ACTN